MGAVRCGLCGLGWAVEGCGVSSTDEHPPCNLPACLSGPTDRETAHHRYHGYGRTCQDSRAQVQGTIHQSIIQLSASQPRCQTCRSIPTMYTAEIPQQKRKQRTEAE